MVSFSDLFFSSRPRHRLLAVAVLSTLAGCSSPRQAAAPDDPAARRIGVAAFNMAWAGSAADFARHLEVCGRPEVNWCETRARTARGAAGPTDEEKARAAACQAAVITAAGGPAASMMVAPCNAYRPGNAPAETMTAAAYAEKLAGLTATVENLIEKEGVGVIAFQEVKSAEVVRAVLGKFAARFDTCEAPHTAFQTIAFAWDRSIASEPGVCAANQDLAVQDPPGDAAAFRRVRPGLALNLTIRGAPVTFMNVHLKSGCANLVSTPRYAGHVLTDPVPPCEVFNRQVPILEEWIDRNAAISPRFVLLGDFNRRIDEERSADIAKDKVRADGSDPAGPNRRDAAGRVTTRYLWPEIDDGAPIMHQVPLGTTASACNGFTGLDHIVVSDALMKTNGAELVSYKVSVISLPDQKIETSDHCPRVVQLRF